MGQRAGRGIGLLGVRHDFKRAFGGDDGLRQQREGIVGLVEIGLALSSSRSSHHTLTMPTFDKQRVLDEGIQHHEAGILLHEDVVDVIGLLLGRGFVLGPTGSNRTTSSEPEKISISDGIRPSMVSATSVETARERPSGAGMSWFMSPR